jgi:hypothetical protein
LQQLKGVLMIVLDKLLIKAQCISPVFKISPTIKLYNVY